jgi:hypothetical protein
MQDLSDNGSIDETEMDTPEGNGVLDEIAGGSLNIIDNGTFLIQDGIPQR